MTQPKPAAVEPPPVGTAPDTIVVPKPEAKREKPTVAATPAGPSAAPKAAPGAKAAAAPAPKEPVPKKESAAAAKPAAAPSLDLDTLEKRLKETNAIGVLTKLTLKNQVDDLLERFKALHQGRSKATLAELRQPFDLLILKVLTLLQDGDPSLASAIRASREAIWGILTDPAKFARL